MLNKFWFISLILFSVVNVCYCGYNDWPAYANTMSRQSIALDGPNLIEQANIKWNANTSPQGINKFQFESATAPIVYNGRVYAIAKYLEPNELAWNGYDQINSQLIAYDSDTGQMLWTTIIDPAIWDSWSSPAIDMTNNNVLIASGSKVYSINALTGAIVWQTSLEKIVLNASVCIANDLEYSRAFITDYDGFGSSGKIYCINLDGNELNNPYEPGQIVWSDILGSTSGNTPAYKNGVVYVSSNLDAESYYGAIYAYDADAQTATRLWKTDDTSFEGFTGGITVTKEGYLYAACYDWAEEEENNSALCKINAANGNIIWITNTERTSTMPVVAGNKIYVSGGIDGYGSRPKMSAYEDFGDSVTKLWETPESLVVGGWTNQPVYANGKLYVGAIPLNGDYFGAYTELCILDTSKAIDSPDFVTAKYTGHCCGNSPAITIDSIYTIGSQGLFRFYQAAFAADVDNDDSVNILDLYAIACNWLFDGAIGIKRADLNLDGKIDFTDYAIFANQYGALIENQ